MKKVKLNPLFALVLAITFIAGCSKDKEEPAVTYVAPQAAAKTKIIEAPTALQTASDPNAAMVNAYISMVNAYGGMSSIFANIPTTATATDLKSSGKSWTWSNNLGYTVWIEFTESTLEYTWKYYIKTPDMASRYLMISATELKSGLGGNLYIYDSEYQGSAVVTYTWTKAASGTITATLLFNNGTDSIFFEVTANSDKSGTFKAYVGTSSAGTKIIDVTWDSTGHGTFWFKDPDTGETVSGTF